MALLATGFVACSSDDSNPSSEQSNQQENSVRNLAATSSFVFDDDYYRKISDFAKDFDTMKAYFNEVMYVGYEEIKKAGVNISNTSEIINYYEKCSDCYEGIKPFMVEFFKDLILEKEEDGVLEVINNYENKVSSFSTSQTDKEYIVMILKSLRIGVENHKQFISTHSSNSQPSYTTYGWGDCMVKNGGRPMGEAIATGFIAGCAGGAWKGAVAGTFTIPGLGTATGAAAGCVLGGASGAIVGAVSTLTFQGLRCLFR